MHRATIWIGLFLVLSLLLLFPTSTLSYDRDVHFSLTLWLAETIGFQEKDAFELAALDDATDEHPETQPLPTSTSDFGVTRRIFYHFVDRRRVDELQRLALACASQRPNAAQQSDIGNYLHAVEDFYSHEGYDPVIGHSLVRSFSSPDRPWNRPFQLRRMLTEKLDALKSIFGKCFGGRVTATFSRIDSGLSVWEKSARDEGRYFADNGPAHWKVLQEHFYGDKFQRYTATKRQDYDIWLARQRQGGWKTP